MKIAANIFGTISPPYTANYNNEVGMDFGPIVLLNNIVRLLFLVGGLIMFLNVVLAGLQFLNAGGDPKAIEQAWNKIWQYLVGLLIMIASFIIAAVAGILFFGSPTAILIPRLYGPN